jgi:hypothetical protein
MHLIGDVANGRTPKSLGGKKRNGRFENSVFVGFGVSQNTHPFINGMDGWANKLPLQYG